MWRRGKLFGIALAASAALAIPLTMLRASARDDARPALERGLAALTKGDPRTARVELMNAIKADPRWAASRLAQSRTLLLLGDGAGAEAELDQARAHGIAVSDTRVAMAHALLLQGQADDALKQLAGGIPADQRAYAARITGRAHQALGNFGAAEAAFAQALILAPKDAPTWVDVARYRLAAGDRAGALMASDRAMTLAPRNVDAIGLRALLSRDQYGPMAALPWFDKALAIDHDALPVLGDYAATLADLGQARRALALTRRMLALDPGNAQAYFIQAVLAARADRPVLAARLLGHANALDGEPAVLLLRGALYLQSGNATLAAEALAALVRIQPLNMRARTLLARAYHDQGAYPQALQTIALLADRADADSYVLLLTARVQEALGNRSAAAALLARATRPFRAGIQAFPAAGSIGALAGTALADGAAAGPNIAYIRALLDAGDIEAAVARADGLATSNRGAPDAQLILGDALMAARRPVDAARAYEAAANLQFSEDTVLRLISAFRMAGQPERAAQALGLFIAQDPSAIDTGRIAATLWMEARDWRRASAALAALRARGGNGDALLMADLAWASLGQGDTIRGLAYAAHGYRLQPASPVTSDAYGWALLKHGGHRQDSIDLLEKAQALAPDNGSIAAHLAQARAAKPG